MENIASKNEKRYERMKETLLMFKKNGLTVYINRPDSTYYFVFGLITDGKDICYIQFDDFGGYKMSYQYVPNLSCGSGIGYPFDGSSLPYVTINSFYDCVKKSCRIMHNFSSVRKYRDIQHFMEDEFHAKNYLKL